jgi:exodeoxyribonuclease VII small subunit
MTANPDRSAAAKAANPAHSAESTELSFETSLAELNDLVNRLESGTLGLSDSIGAYERGVTILRHLHEQLADVEERVRLLVRIDDQGRPILTDIGTASAGPATPAQTQPGPAPVVGGDAHGRRAPRSAPRTGRPKRLPGMDDAGEEV